MIKNSFFFLRKSFKNNHRVYLLEFLVILMVSVLFFSACVIGISKRGASLREAKTSGTEHVLFEGNIPVLSAFEKEENGIEAFSRFTAEYGAYVLNDRMVSVRTEWYEEIDKIPLEFELRGELPKDENEVIISEEIRYSLGTALEIGDSISYIDYDGNSRTFVISGIYTLPYAAEGSQSVTRAFSNGKDRTEFSYAAIEFESEYGIAEKCENLTGALGTFLYSIHTGRVAAYFQNEDGINGKTLAFYAILIAVFLVVSATMLKSSYEVRKHVVSKEYAIMRSLGATKNTLYCISLLEGIFMGVTGGVVGCFLANFIVRIGFVLVGYEITSESLFQIEGMVPSVIITLLTVTILLVVIKLRVTAEVVRSTIHELLVERKKIHIKKREGKTYRNPIFAYIKTSLERNKGRVILCVASFAGSILVFVLLSGYEKDMMGLFEVGASPYYNVTVELNRGYTESKSTDILEKILEEVEGVDGVCADPISFEVYPNIDEAFMAAEADNRYQKENGVYSTVSVCVYDEKELAALKDTLISGSLSLGEGECILVNETFSLDKKGEVDYTETGRVSGFAVGSNIRILNVAALEAEKTARMANGTYTTEAMQSYMATLEEKDVLNLTIKGTVTADLEGKSFYSPVLIISEDYYEALREGNDAEYARIKVKLQKDFSITQLQKACIAYKEFGEVQYVGSGIMNSDSMISTMGAFYGEILAVVLVGVINMFCIIMLDWEIQKKEYAILRSVGATKINVLKVIVAEKGYIGLLSLLIGCVGGTILEKLLLRISIEEKVPFTLPWFEVGISVVTMILIVAITVGIQSRLIQNMNIADELKQAEE